MPRRPLPTDPADLRPIRDELKLFIDFWRPRIAESRESGRRPRLPRRRPELTLAAPYIGFPLNPGDPMGSNLNAWIRRFSDPAVGRQSGVVELAVILLDDVLRAIEAGGLRTPGPLERALELLVDTPEGGKLVRYLDGRPGREAHLHDIAIAIDEAKPADARIYEKAIRKRFRHARDLLEDGGSPLRLEIDNSVIRLVSAADPPTGHAP